MNCTSFPRNFRSLRNPLQRVDLTDTIPSALYQHSLRLCSREAQLLAQVRTGANIAQPTKSCRSRSDFANELRSGDNAGRIEEISFLWNTDRQSCTAVTPIRSSCRASSSTQTWKMFFMVSRSSKTTASKKHSNKTWTGNFFKAPQSPL